jgi:hypothetical protein
MNFLTRIQLTIKSKELAFESSLIRKTATKLYNKGCRYEAENIRRHRQMVVSPESRATGLVLGFLRNVPYKAIEHKRKETKELEFQNIVLPRVAAMLKKYDQYNRDSFEQFKKWLEQ